MVVNDTLSAMFYQGALSTVGDPTWLGILVFVFFGGFVMLQNVGFSTKIAIMVPAILLSLFLFPSTTWAYIAVFVFVLIVYIGLKRVFNR